MKTVKIILRVLALPFILVIALLGIIIKVYLLCKNFLLYGGEFIAYEKDSHVMIKDVYLKVEALIEELKKEGEAE